MTNRLKLAVTGIGNNISALVQGVGYYRQMIDQGQSTDELPGIRNYMIGDIRVTDIDFVAAFDVQKEKIGLPISSAIFEPPNNYPNLGLGNIDPGAVVQSGLRFEEGKVIGHDEVVSALKESGAEVLLYSLPTGLLWAAEEYAKCALDAGVGFVNCTPEVVARNIEIMNEFDRRNLALIGDDLASHMGTSMIHRALLNLLIDRGLDLENTYQLNLGGNEDFRNLHMHGESKAVSKKNALAQSGLDADRVHVIPSAGFVPHLQDRKVAFLNVIGRGWANTPISIDLKLEVQDSSNAAGVIIDLIRIAAASQRCGKSGFNAAASSFLKSPPGGHETLGKEIEARAFESLSSASLKKTG